MEGQEESLTIEGIRASLGLTDPAPEEPPATEPPAEPTATEPPATEQPEEANKSEDGNGENPPAPPSGQQTKTPPPQELPLEKLNKEAHTFAEMRTTIASQNKILADIGAALGIKGKPEEIMAGLKKITTAQQAKEAGVPPEIMERLTALEAEKAERAANDKKIQVYAAINTFQRNQGLTQQQLQEFLMQLANNGKNPFEQDVDLRSEYLVMNFDRLQKEAIQKALEEQAKRDQYAQDHGSNPGTRSGGGEHKTTEVKTLDDLDAFLKANIK